MPFCFVGDKAVAGERQTVEIPEHAQSEHLFQFFGDFIWDGDTSAAESNDVPRIIVPAPKLIRILAETA